MRWGPGSIDRGILSGPLQELADTHRLLAVAATGSSFPSEKQRAGEVITSRCSNEHPGVICYA